MDLEWHDTVFYSFFYSFLIVPNLPSPFLATSGHRAYFFIGLSVLYDLLSKKSVQRHPCVQEDCIPFHVHYTYIGLH